MQNVGSEFFILHSKEDAQKSHPTRPEAKSKPQAYHFTRPTPSRPRPALVPRWGTLRTLASRERTGKGRASWRAWGGLGEIRPFSASSSLVARPAVYRRLSLSMAGEAPTHFIGGGARSVPDIRHATMAIDTSESRSQVHFMREIHEIGQPLQPDPFNGFVLSPVVQHLLGFSGLPVQRSMATHAERDRRNRRDGRIGGMPMAKKTIDAEATGVKSMAEIDRLPILNGQVRAARRVQQTDDAGHHPGGENQRDSPPGVHGTDP